MKKFVLVHNGEEIKIGDYLVRQSTTNTPFGKATVKQEIKVTEQALLNLIEAKIIKPIMNNHHEDNKPEHMQINYYINKIAKRMNWAPKKAANYINTIMAVYPSAGFNIILKEIAIELDKKYSDHIRNSAKIFVVSLMDGKIRAVNKAHIENYRNFAAFRSLKDALLACEITEEILNKMFDDAK